MKSVTLPSGQICRPKKLQSIYKNRDEWFANSASYGLAARLNPSKSAATLWKENPYVVSSVNPSDYSIYNPSK